MSLLSSLGLEFQPTAAYSFEFFTRDEKTKKPSNRLTEVFFLLPPEEYSMEEGYRINITKTSAGGWIDDFGNDFKTLKLSGSLYSYYTGYPASVSNLSGSQGGIKDFVKRTADNVVQSAKGVARSATQFLDVFGISIPGLRAISGLDEFFKLRYIVSRFRDEVISEQHGKETSKLSKVFPEVQEIILASKEGRMLYDKIAIIFHDYDDNNHYEVIFNKFSTRRAKDDPFTLLYDIEMVCVREIKGAYLGLGKSVKREKASEYLTEIRKTFDEVLDNIRTIVNIPLEVLDSFLELKTLVEDLYSDFISFTKNISSDFTYFQSKISNIITKNDSLMEDSFTFTTGKPLDDLKNETYNLTPDYENVIPIIGLTESNKEFFSQLSGTDKYLVYEDNQKVFNTANKALSDIDFNVDSQAQSDNVFLTRDEIYYIVQQGDTLPILANKFYGDYEKSNIIAESNSLTNRDFENGNMIGKSIIIPLTFRTSSSLINNNLIYFRKLKISTLIERQKQLLGSDIKLNDNREVVADGTGDLAMEYGEDCYLENVSDRLKFKAGTLSPIHPSWGLSIAIGEAPLPIALTKIFDNIEEQILSDPRTQYARVDRDNADIIADNIYIPLYLKAYSAEEKTLNAGDLMSGILV